MRAVLSYLGGALVLVLIGGALVNASRLDRTVAEAQENLVAARYADAAAGFEAAEGYLGYASWLPWVGNEGTDMRARQAAVSYWQHEYGEIVPAETEPLAEVSADDLGLQLIVANAVYRSGQAQWTDRESTLAALDAGIGAYLTVLKNDSDSEDAAFNFEYLLRLRREIETGESEPGELFVESDGSQGQKGGPPQELETGEFEIYIPLESDELDKAVGAAGKAGERKRKG